MRLLNNCVIWGPQVYEYSKAVETPVHQSTAYLKSRELEFNECINVPEPSFISDRRICQSALTVRFRVKFWSFCQFPASYNVQVISSAFWFLPLHTHIAQIL